MIHVQDLAFHYPSGFALRVPEWRVAAGGQVALVGPSGSGKTTLLHLLTGIRRPDSGLIEVAGQDVSKMDEGAARAFRLRTVGFVFQTFELLDYLSVLENVLVPYLIDGRMKLTPEVKERARRLAADMGLEARLKGRVTTLSQGEKQRVAICRALIAEPRLLIADEPTGNLDPAGKRRILNLLQEQARRTGATLLMVTHDQSLLDAFADVRNVGQWGHVEARAGA